MIKCKVILLMALLTMSFASQAYTGIPVANPINMSQLAQQIGLSNRQLYELQALLSNGVRQLQEAQRIYGSVTGRWTMQDTAHYNLRRELEGFITYNVPSAYADLLRSVVGYHIAPYFQRRRSEYPELKTNEIDPWGTSPDVVKQVQDEQNANDVTISYMESAYDSVPKRLEHIQFLMNQGPQPNVNAAVNLNTMAVLEQARAMQQLIQMKAVESSAEARHRNGRYVEARKWSKFVGVPDPQAAYGYPGPRSE